MLGKGHTVTQRLPSSHVGVTYLAYSVVKLTAVVVTLNLPCLTVFLFWRRQVPVNGNALFSAVALSEKYLETGEHAATASPEIEAEAKDLRQV